MGIGERDIGISSELPRLAYSQGGVLEMVPVCLHHITAVRQVRYIRMRGR